MYLRFPYVPIHIVLIKCLRPVKCLEMKLQLFMLKCCLVANFIIIFANKTWKTCLKKYIV